MTENIKQLTVSQTNLAKALGLTTGRVNQLIDEGVVIRDERDKSGGVMLFDSLRNYYGSKATNAEAEGLDYWEEKAKHEKVKRETSELKLKKLDGSVYSAKIVELVIIEQNSMLRTNLLGLPVKLAPQIEGKSRDEIYELMTKEIEELLNNLSKYKPEMFKEEIEDNGGGDDG